MGTLASGSIDLKSLKIAGGSATNYITTIDGGGIKVHDAGDDDNYIQLTSAGMEIYKGGDSEEYKIANFSEVCQIGTNNNSHLLLTSNDITAFGESNKTFFKISSDSATNSNISIDYQLLSIIDDEMPASSNNSLSLTLPETPVSGTNLIISVDVYEMRGQRRFIGSLQFTRGTSSSQTLAVNYSDSYHSYTNTLYITYNGTDSFTNVYLRPNGNGGQGTAIISIMCNYVGIGSAPSYQLGGGSQASGAYSLCEGYYTIASGDYSHAEGSDTTASGNYSHAEGQHTIASHSYTHAQNEGTTANKIAQTVIGTYNILDATPTTAIHPNNNINYGNYAFIIGNGTSSTRSNALTVNWKGDVNIASGAKYKINGNALSASDVGAVPTTRTVNSKALSSNITLSPSDMNIVDFIVEQGTVDDWIYRKWNSGIAEAWKTINQTSAMNTSSSGWYRSGGTTLKNIGSSPQINGSYLFTEMPKYTVSAHASNNIAMVVCNANGYSLANLGDVTVWRGNSNTTSFTVYYDIYCIGTWK